MDAREPMVFEDLALIEVPVTVGSQQYILREANGDAACKFQNARVARYEYNEEGKLVKLRDTADLEPILVSLCLFMQDGTTPVSEVTIRSWPGKIQNKLYDRAKEISGLNETEDLATMEKQLANLQKRVDKMRKAGNPAKNS